MLEGIKRIGDWINYRPPLKTDVFLWWDDSGCCPRRFGAGISG
jgi:hypothetical protein